MIHVDNARPHTAKSTLLFLKSHRIKTLGHGGAPINFSGGVPPNSPDLSPIEYVFSFWQHRVAIRAPKTTAELIRVGTEEWAKIKMDTIRKTMKHMLHVYRWVREHNGALYGCE